MNRGKHKLKPKGWLRYVIIGYDVFYSILSYPILSYPILSYPILSYPDRLMKLCILPVSYWHEQKDLCTLHKLLKNAYDIKTSTYVSPKLVKSRTSSGLVLQPHFSRTLSFKNSYFNRVTSSWNALPEPIRSAKTFFLLKFL